MSFFILFVSVIIVLGIGLLLGFIIALASYFLSVQRVARVEEVQELLPGANCGACGYAGCSAYAEAVVTEGASLSCCTSLTKEALNAIAAIMGLTVEAQAEPLKAYIACHASPFSPEGQQFQYKGLEDCVSRSLFYSGSKKCKHGCLGGGSCISSCPVDAIFKDNEGRVMIDREKCISCGRCVTVCPMKVIKMIPQSADFAVACSHPGKALQTKSECSVGCLGCTLCTKKSPEGGFFMDGFLAKIDYNKKGSRAEAMEKCPVRCIERLG